MSMYAGHVVSWYLPTLVFVDGVARLFYRSVIVLNVCSSIDLGQCTRKISLLHNVTEGLWR